MLRHPEETQPGQSGQSTDPSGLPADSHFDAADPPRGRRSLALALLVVLGLTCLATGCLLYISGSDALRGNTVTDVGNLANANLERVGPFISGTGEPARSALAFERKGERGSKRLVRLAQRPRFWIVFSVPEGVATYVPPAKLEGRLHRLDRPNPKLHVLKKMIEEEGGGDYLLLEGQRPEQSRPTLISSGAFFLLGLGILLWAAYMRRAIRKSPAAVSEATRASNAGGSE